MDKAGKEKLLLAIITILAVIVIGASLLDLCMEITVPGLGPIASALFWATLWRLYYIRRQHPGGIWTFAYLLIIILNLISGISQIINAFA